MLRKNQGGATILWHDDVAGTAQARHKECTLPVLARNGVGSLINLKHSNVEFAPVLNIDSILIFFQPGTKTAECVVFSDIGFPSSKPWKIPFS